MQLLLLQTMDNDNCVATPMPICLLLKVANFRLDIFCKAKSFEVATIAHQCSILCHILLFKYLTTVTYQSLSICPIAWRGCKGWLLEILLFQMRTLLLQDHSQHPFLAVR